MTKRKPENEMENDAKLRGWMDDANFREMLDKNDGCLEPEQIVNLCLIISAKAREEALKERLGRNFVEEANKKWCNVCRDESYQRGVLAGTKKKLAAVKDAAYKEGFEKGKMNICSSNLFAMAKEQAAKEMIKKVEKGFAEDCSNEADIRIISLKRWNKIKKYLPAERKR
jgi:hypothetical protein